MDSQQIVRAIKFYEKKEEEIKILNVKKEMIDSEIKSKLSIIEKLTRQEEDTKRAADVIQECLNVFNEQYLNRIKKLLNAALKFVFFDLDYEFVVTTLSEHALDSCAVNIARIKMLRDIFLEIKS
jgi:hypothetical protein